MLSVIAFSAACRIGPASAAPRNAIPALLTARGAAQRPGDVGKVGVMYTLGEGDSFCNFTVRKFSFVATRIIMNGRTFFPDGDKKFLVMDYTLRNPNKSVDLRISSGTIAMTAVAAAGQNYDLEGGAENTTANQPLAIDLKPGERVDCRMYTIVPAAIPIPKAILNYGGAQVLRYDLRGVVAPVEPIVADPADKAGAVSRAIIPDAKIGITYPSGQFDLTLEKVEFTDLPIGGTAPDVDKRYLVATIRAKNALTPAGGDVDITNSNGAVYSVLTGDGNVIDSTGNYWKTTSEDKADTTIPTGFEKHFRLFFQVPRAGSLKSLTLSEGKSYRKLVYSLKGIR